MKLYEIDKAILDLIDEETGEIADFEQFEALNIERSEKLENVALWVKDLKAEADAISTEIKNLTARKTAALNKAESLKGLLKYALNGEKFSTPKVAVSYRKSKSTAVDDGFIEWAQTNAPDLLKFAEPSANLTAIKTAIEDGREIEHATIKENNSIQIK